MPRINLLPWREELRKRRQREVAIAAVAALGLGALFVFAAKTYWQGLIDHQNERNAIIQSEIVELDKKIEEIQGLENQKERLLARMRIIDQLQRSRPEVVHVFDELVRAVPEGVYFTEVEQRDKRIEISGAAQSSTRVSALMRQLDASDWFRDPGLEVVETTERGPERTAEFTLFVTQVSTTDEEGAVE